MWKEEVLTRTEVPDSNILIESAALEERPDIFSPLASFLLVRRAQSLKSGWLVYRRKLASGLEIHLEVKRLEIVTEKDICISRLELDAARAGGSSVKPEAVPASHEAISRR